MSSKFSQIVENSSRMKFWSRLSSRRGVPQGRSLPLTKLMSACSGERKDAIRAFISQSFRMGFGELHWRTSKTTMAICCLRGWFWMAYNCMIRRAFRKVSNHQKSFEIP